MKKSIKEYPGWIDIPDHLQTEKLLRNRPAGTYILRKGDFSTQVIEENLSRENKKQIHCYVLTIKEQESKITDILLVEMENRWLLYYDNPDILHDFHSQYDSLEELMKFLQDKAKYPYKENKGKLA